MRRHGCRSLNLLHAMQPLMTSFILLSFMIICRASSFLRQVGCGQLSRRQTQNALVRFHASSTSAVAQTTGETAIVSKDDSSTITSLLPYFSIYYNGKPTIKIWFNLRCSLFTNKLVAYVGHQMFGKLICHQVTDSP